MAKISKNILLSISLIVSAAITFVMILQSIFYEIDYALVSLSLLLIVILVLFYIKGNIPIKIRSFNVILFLDYLFVGVSFFMFVSNLIDFNSNLIDIMKFGSSIFAVFFVPGWTILRLVRFHEKTSAFVTLVVSFACSIAVTALLYSLNLVSPLFSNPIIVSALYLSISIIPSLSRNSKSKGNTNDMHKLKTINLFEAILLIWILAFVLSTFLTLYPQMAYVPGSDIIRHYSSVMKLNESSSIFYSEYPWFHFNLAMVSELSNPELWLFQSGLPLLNIFVIFAFYIVSKKYLSFLNGSLPIVSTIFFTIFSGLGWIYFVQNLTSNARPDDLLALFYSSYYASYFDIGVGQSAWLWLWFRPISIGFCLFFVLLYMLKVQNIRLIPHICITTLLMLSLIFVHFSEFSVFVLIVFLTAALFPQLKINYISIIASNVISLSIALVLSIFYSTTLSNDPGPFRLTYWILLYILSFISIIFLKLPRRPKISVNLNYKRIASGLLLIYGIIFLFWLVNSEVLKANVTTIISNPAYNYAIPTAMYGVIFGSLGFFAIPSLIYVLKYYRSNPIVIFPIIMISVFILAKVISFINIQFEGLGYWERRMIPYLWMCFCILAAVPLSNIKRYLHSLFSNHSWFSLPKNIILGSTIGLLIFSGIFSTLITIEYHQTINENNVFSKEEVAIQDELRQYDPTSTFLTITSRSQTLPQYVNLNYIIGYYKYQVWPSNFPEFPLNILFGLNNSAIIYMSEEDNKAAYRNDYVNGYIYSHFLKEPFDIKKTANSSNLVYIDRMAPPVSVSDTILVIPKNMTSTEMFAYDILSLSHINYTTADLNDISTIQKGKTIITPNKDIADRIEKLRNVYDLKFQKLIVLNLNVHEYMTSIPAISVRNENVFPNSLIIPSEPPSEEIRNITLRFDFSTDLSPFNYVKLEWYGLDSNKIQTIQFISNPGEYIRYSFADTWLGPRQIYLPIIDSTEDYYHNINEFPLNISHFGKPDWSSIEMINTYEVNDSTIVSITENDHMIPISERVNLGNISFLPGTKSNSIESLTADQEITLPNNIVTNPILLNDSYYRILNYSNDIPFLFHKSNSAFDTYILNIFPLVQEVHINRDKSDLFKQVLINSMDLIDNGLGKYVFKDRNPSNLVAEGTAAFKQANLSGEIQFDSSSAIIETSLNDANLNIDGKTVMVDNLTRIFPLEVERVQINTNNSTIKGGHGFYSNIKTYGNSIIKFEGEPVRLGLIIDGDAVQIEGKNISFIGRNLDFTLREPSVKNDGLSRMTNFYAYGDLNKKLGILDSDLLVNGSVHFDINYGDEFSLAKDTEIGGKILEPRLDYFEEMENFGILKLSDLTYVFIFFLIFLIYNFYFVKNDKDSYAIKDNQL